MSTIILFALTGLLSQDMDSPTNTRSKYDAIVKRNIFAPPAKPEIRNEKSPEKETPRETKPSPAPVWVLTGIFFDSNTREHRLIVEKRPSADAQVRVLRAEDVIDKLTVQSVNRDGAVLRAGKQTIPLRLGDEIPAGTRE